MNHKITFNIDFDGTCTTHDFPRIGKDIGAVPVLKDLVSAGHKLILFTMRSDREGMAHSADHPEVHPQSDMYLTHAVQWFRDNEIPLHGIQTNPDQRTWTDSPKSYAHLMIDDSALGCPLVHGSELSPKPFVDWVAVRKSLELMGILRP